MVHRLRLGWKGVARLAAKSMFCFLFCIRLSIRLLRTQPNAQVATGLKPSVSSHLSPLLLRPLGEERKAPCQRRGCEAAAAMVQLRERSVYQNIGRTCASVRMSRWMRAVESWKRSRGVEEDGWPGGYTQRGTSPLGSSVHLACLSLPFKQNGMWLTAPPSSPISFLPEVAQVSTCCTCIDLWLLVLFCF